MGLFIFGFLMYWGNRFVGNAREYFLIFILHEIWDFGLVRKLWRAVDDFLVHARWWYSEIFCWRGLYAFETMCAAFSNFWASHRTWKVSMGSLTDLTPDLGDYRNHRKTKAMLYTAGLDCPLIRLVYFMRLSTFYPQTESVYRNYICIFLIR